MAHENPLRGLTTAGMDAAWPELRDRSDRALVESTMEILGDPPVDEADSFVLHAPLELMARAELLPAVAPSARDEARRRIAEIAAQWNTRHPHAGAPILDDRTEHHVSAAIDRGDLDAADRAVLALAAHGSLDQFIGLAAEQLPGHLGGAAHLSIFLDQAGRLTRPDRAALLMSRALIRDLARHPDWRLRWIDRPSPARRSAPSFTDVLAGPPSAGDPGSNFIYPTMHLVDSSGLAAELLAAPVASTSIDEARRQLMRIAAMSMLQDDPASAPYGWTHCLTMPQATLAVAHRVSDPTRAVAIAATYVLGFRATLSSQAIDVDWRPPRPRANGGLLDGDCAHAASLAWHSNERDVLVDQLVTYAATHRDAHLVKYTLACLHAVNDDADAAPLYLAAAAYLAAWWIDADRRSS